ncbi:SPJ_0845 family protein [Lentilactobacillus laojiaonis]|uniref:SPJ_0845 family protein n=1 Tax=Lentilactobacillus laojiaonis TaxID=2883998 RepID=UPI001D0B816E|nr:SPJ_0845 family protein [Lentilactobacillus laojiaonis]UDM32522.1 hypothetical protein LHL71_02050 [Lentilactobacillus laojiaonis]
MALKINRKDDLDAMFGKFSDMDIDDPKRDKFLKHSKKATVKEKTQSNKDKAIEE